MQSTNLSGLLDAAAMGATAKEDVLDANIASGLARAPKSA